MFATTILGVTLGAIWYAMLFVVWVFIALLPATIARNKGRSFWLYFLLSLFFWWITIFVVLLMKDESGGTAAPTEAEE